MSLLNDLRYSIRLLRKTPVHTMTTVFVLVIGLSLYMASYTMATMRTTKPMPFPDGDRYVFLNANDPAGAFEQSRNAFDLYTYHRLLNSSENYTVLGAMQRGSAIISDGVSYSRQLSSATLSVELLSATAVNPVLGRMLTLEDAQSDAEGVALISYELWQDYFNGNPNIVGAISQINGQATNIIGVMPEGFHFPRQENIWLPLKSTASALPREGAVVSMAGILRRDVSLESADAELDVLLQGLTNEYPDLYDPRIALVTHYARWGSGQVLNMGVMSLLIACITLALTTVNLSSLLFMRSTSRNQELAVRASVGAGGWELVKQLLLESFLICLIGMIFSLLLSMFFLNIMESVFFSDPFWYEFELNSQTVLMGSLVTLLIWLAAGVTVAYRAKSAQPASMLAEGSKEFAKGGKGNIAKIIVSVEVVLSCFLLVLTGTLIVLIERTNVKDFGANTENLATASIDLSTIDVGNQNSRAQVQLNYLTDLVDELDANSDITELAITTAYPGVGGQFGRFRMEEALSTNDDDLEGQATIWVSENYFDFLDVEVLEGRSFDSGDSSSSADVVILAEDFATLLWPNESPIGNRIVATIGTEDVSLLVVGVISRIEQENTSMEAFYLPSLYRPLSQDAPQNMYLVTKYQPQVTIADLAQAIRQAGARVDRNVPIEDFGVWDVQTGDADTLTLMSEAFALATFLLASIGVFTVLSRTINQRTHEIGIRRALGSSNFDIFAKFGKQGLYFLVLGIVLGCLPALLAFVYLLVSVLDVTDIAVLPVIALSVALLMAAIIALSCYIPTRQAIRLEPADALRYE